MKKENVLSKIDSRYLNGVAHRGLHNSTITENSISAFKSAIDNNIPFELDVHLSKDNHLIVCHDSSLKRTTNKEGIIEDLTLEEIKNNYRLLNGEEVPTLSEVLYLNQEQVPMVIELKPYNKNHRLLAKKLLDLLNAIKDHKKIIIISFYPQCLLHVKKSPFINLLLVNKENKWVYKLRKFFDGVDLEYLLFNDKKFQNSKNEQFTMCWTIETEEAYNLSKKYADSITFQYLDINKIKM